MGQKTRTKKRLGIILSIDHIADGGKMVTHNAIISRLYSGDSLTSAQCADIAEELDQETAQVTLRINRMIEQLDTVIEQGELFPG